MTSLEDLLANLDKIQGISAVGLVMLTGITWGYLLRYVKSFPNNGIPVAVILWCAAFMLFLADPRPTTMSPRIWTARNLGVGLVLGLASWMAHYFVLSWIEDQISKRFGKLKSVDTDPPASNDSPKTP